MGTAMAAADVVLRLEHDIREQLAPYHDDQDFALLDFPDHPNVGDSAIWLGELAYFAKWAKPPAYVCAKEDVDWDELAKTVPSGPIYIHGGGNFGDLWPAHQDFRIEVLRRFPGRLVIQLPQSIHFGSADDIETTRRAIAAHGRFILMVRDHESFAFATAHFDCTTTLCPDMAFCLGTLRLRAAPIHDELFLLRTDLERVDWGAPEQAPNRLIADWLNEPRGLHPRMRAAAMVAGLFGGFMMDKARLSQSYFEKLARHRVERGLRQLSSARHVTTDRLHAHILSTLLGVPHTVRDNSYGKISRFMKAWNTGWDGVDVQQRARPVSPGAETARIPSLEPGA